jgi:hypothetical protein
MAAVAQFCVRPLSRMNDQATPPESESTPEPAAPAVPLAPQEPQATQAPEEDAQDEPTQAGGERSAPKRKRIYFNPDRLPPSYPAYVAWLDVMGSRAAMSQSLFRSSQYIGRLHVAILMHRKKPGLQTSPFMDGAYVRAEYQRNMLEFLWGVFEELAHDFLTSREHRHRFMPRCGLSFGHIIQGINIPTDVSIILGAYSNSVYREGIYLGYPMVQAHGSEALAAPFGVAIHESARSFSQDGDRPLSGLWWRWHTYRRPDYLDDFIKMLMSYFDWCDTHTHSLDYPKERIAAHRAMAYEYFDIDQGA